MDGHREGAEAVRRTVTAAPSRGISTLTLYAFSSDNWRRPATEVGHLMRLFRRYLRSECDRCVREGVRVSVIGRRDRLGRSLVGEIESVEARTRGGDVLHLLLAVDYSARDAILRAAGLQRESPAGRAPSRRTFSDLLARALHVDGAIPEVDLLVRTGGERRLSDFLLWECAYAELVFTPRLWPDFGEEALDAALEEYGGRERRYGGLPGRATEPAIHARTGDV